MHTCTLKTCGFTRISLLIPKHGFSVLLTIRTKNTGYTLEFMQVSIIIIYDPLRNKNNTDIVGSVVQAYANCDFAEALEQQKADTSEILKWIQLHVDGQLQDDSHNCGVLSLISFFRGIRKLNEPGRTEVTAANLAAKWKCGHSIDAFTVYGKNLLKLILSESTDPTAFEYFYNVLQDYISSG
jgi:hypothetical protein